MENTCIICKSPIKKELDSLIDNGVDLPLIAEKYCNILHQKKTILLALLKEHKKKKHNKINQIIDTGNAIPMHTYETASEKLLQEGINDPDLEFLGPEKKLKLAAQLKRVDLEGRKLQLGQDALKLSIARFLGGFIEPPKTGEITHEEVIPITASKLNE